MSIDAIAPIKTFIPETLAMNVSSLVCSIFRTVNHSSPVET